MFMVEMNGLPKVCASTHFWNANTKTEGAIAVTKVPADSGKSAGKVEWGRGRDNGGRKGGTWFRKLVP